MEAGAPPSEKLLAGMGPMMEEMVRSGILVSGEGLRPSSKGVRLKFSGGKRTVTQGPLTGGNELTAAFSIVSAKSMDEAIEFATRFASADSEIDVRPVTEVWDLGFAPKPEGALTRFMIIQKANEATESGAPPVRMNEDTVVFAPSREAVRLRFAGGRRHVVDGPFAESKELIAGYVILNVKSRDEMVEWASRFAALIGDIEIDITPLR
jgi:hypothetical protein